MNDLQRMAATVALEQMSRNGYFSICTIDKINAMSGGVPNGEAYQILAALHCVNFRDMPPELQRGLPVLVKLALGGQAIDFAMPTVVNVTPGRG